MNKRKLLVVTFCLAILSAIATPTNLLADDWDQTTKLTFSEPVQVPGEVLPAGNYWFTLVNSEGSRHIVQIWNADRTHLMTMIFAIPDYRTQPKEETVIRFEERRSGQPKAIHSWFYPGSNDGEEFVYPNSRTIQIKQ